MNPVLRVATINLLNDLSRWPERRALLARMLKPLSLDLIGLQEVTRPLGLSTAHELADDLGGYSVFVAPKTGTGRSREGIAILSKNPIERHEILDLQSQQRVAQRVEIHVGGRHVVFVNGHYHWSPGFHAARLRQVDRVLEWLTPYGSETAIIASGDFNGTPHSPAIIRMNQTFRSAHAIQNGDEPEFTYPTALTSRDRVRSVVTRRLLQLFSNRPGESWRGTLDYIFVSRNIDVLDCKLILDQPFESDSTLYASDHFGLMATFTSPSRSPPPSLS